MTANVRLDVCDPAALVEMERVKYIESGEVLSHTGLKPFTQVVKLDMYSLKMALSGRNMSE
jgi:hypothetical protein